MQKIGIDYPIVKGNVGFFNQTFDSLTNIKSNLNVLLNTMFGERPFNPEIGLSLQKYLFEPMTNDLKEEIINHIQNQIDKYIPYITINKLDVNFNDKTTSDNISRNIITIFVEFLFNGDSSTIVVSV